MILWATLSQTLFKASNSKGSAVLYYHMTTSIKLGRFYSYCIRLDSQKTSKQTNKQKQNKKQTVKDKTQRYRPTWRSLINHVTHYHLSAPFSINYYHVRRSHHDYQVRTFTITPPPPKQYTYIYSYTSNFCAHFASPETVQITEAVGRCLWAKLDVAVFQRLMPSPFSSVVFEAMKIAYLLKTFVKVKYKRNGCKLTVERP